MCDASNNCIDAVLSQISGKGNEPLGFYSKKFSGLQRNYSTYDRDLLAIYSAVLHFRPLIEGRSLVILTDHKPLTFALTNKSTGNGKESQRRVRQLDFIAQFSTDIHYLKGEGNFVTKIAEAQMADKQLEELKKKDDLQFIELYLSAMNLKVICETSTGRFRSYVPLEF